jgi:hypothetical protein
LAGLSSLSLWLGEARRKVLYSGRLQPYFRCIFTTINFCPNCKLQVCRAFQVKKRDMSKLNDPRSIVKKNYGRNLLFLAARVSVRGKPLSLV